MKRFILSIISLVAVMTLGTMPSYLAYAASKSTIGTSTSTPTSTSTSTPTPTSTSTPTPTSTPSRSVIPTVINNVKVDGKVTIWAGAMGFNDPAKQDPIHVIANLVKDPKKGIWNVTVTKLSIPWEYGTVFTLQDGKVGSGIFRPSTNAVSMTLPLQNKIPKNLQNKVPQDIQNKVPSFLRGKIPMIASKLPSIITLQISLSTDGSIKAPTGRIIHGSPVDPDGRIAMVGSASHVGMFNLANAQAWMQGTISPWPFTNSPAPTKKPAKHVS